MNIECPEQCKASGEFSFTRFGVLHTIAFVAFIQSRAIAHAARGVVVTQPPQGILATQDQAKPGGENE